MQLKTLNLTIASILLALTLQGCSTVSGFGQDISAMGNAIDRKAREVKGN